MLTTGQSTAAGPELVLALVGAVGTDLELVTQMLAQALESVDYKAEPPIRLSSLLREAGFAGLPALNAPLDEYINAHMDAGNELRQRSGLNDALALLAIGEIIQERKEAGVPHGGVIQRRAYILRSLKHPEEAKRLRDVYGPAFFLIAAYASHAHKRNYLAKGIAQSRNEFPVDRHYSTAEALISRDEQEFFSYGQNVRDTFHRADVFLDTTDPDELGKSIKRFIELLFGNTFHTPTRKEFAMFHASASALRSAELGRQVGAAIANRDGDIIAVGTNEVPKAGGGLYWCDDKPDRREFSQGFDSNEQHKRNVLADTLKHLRERGWLSLEKARQDIPMLVAEAFDGDSPVLPSRSQIRNLIEFGRAVHAEMAALTDAARRGTAVAGASMYVTTFPCHLCARHIVAAGIERLFFIEPYAKSLTAELYPDSIALETTDPNIKQVVFEPFVGISPRQYMNLFTAARRKSLDGKVNPFRASGALPRYFGVARVYLENEDAGLSIIKKKMHAQGLLIEQV